MNCTDSRIRDYILSEFAEAVPGKEAEHSFSKHYLRRRKRIIRKYARVRKADDIHTVYQRRAMKYAFIMTVIAISYIVGFTDYISAGGFNLTPHKEQSQVYYFGDISGYPETLTSRYTIENALYGYSEQILCDTDTNYSVYYTDKNGGDVIISQWVASVFKGDICINTENAAVLPTDITINGHSGFYYATGDGRHCCCIVFDDCIMIYSCSKDKQAVIDLVGHTSFKNLE